MSGTIENELYEILGDTHTMTSACTPLRPDAFEKTEEEKIEIIRQHFAGIMETLGLDLNDDSLKGTPHRVAKMYVKEIFRGLNPKYKPSLSIFDNKYQYGKMLVESNITLLSACEHHFLPIRGKAHIAYISSGKVIGLSKINRMVSYYAQRPQVQERLTLQIFNELKEVLETEDIIIVIEAEHMCVSMRGIRDPFSSTTTIEYSGQFQDKNLREDFFRLIQS